MRLLLISLPLLIAAQQTLKVDVTLINVFATVQDANGEFVAGLSRDDFRLYEDNQSQNIAVFETQDQVETSAGLLIDSSGSMVDILPLARRGVLDFTAALPATDEYFVAAFNNAVRLVANFGGPRKRLEEQMALLKPWATSALYDALSYGADKVSGSIRERKALITVTDGHDNGSALSLRELREQLQRSPVLFYFVAVGSRRLIDVSTLEELSGMSGGRTAFVGKNENLPAVFESIRTELSKQDYLGYYVQKSKGFHTIRVEVPGRNLKIRARTGYLG